MMRFLPLILAFVAVGAVAVYDGLTNFRWTPNYQAEAYAALLDVVPKEVGAWKGKDYTVDDDILRTAGAEGYVSRLYTNAQTEQAVKVWLIVGPFKHVVRHTPNICYPSNDFRNSIPIEFHSFDGVGENQFLTSIYHKGPQLDRVFWSWHKPAESGEVVWFAEDGIEANRARYAGTPALFKLYFTTSSDVADEPVEESAAIEFAKEFLPMLNGMIKSERQGGSAAASFDSDAQEPVADDA